MKQFTRTIVTLALLSAVTTSAFAQAEGGNRPEINFTPNTVIVVMPNGTVAMKKVSDQTMAELMANGAKPLGAGVMLMMHNGKVFVVQDKKMPNGKMLSDAATEAQ